MGFLIIYLIVRKFTASLTLLEPAWVYCCANEMFSELFERWYGLGDELVAIAWSLFIAMRLY